MQVLFFVLLTTLFTSKCFAMSDQEAEQLGCIKCAPLPIICNCPPGYSCEIRERTCAKCHSIICRPPAVVPGQSSSQTASVAGEVTSAAAPPSIPVTVFSSTSCIFPSTVPVESTAMQTIVGQVPQTVSQVVTGTILQKIYSSATVPIEVAGTIVVAPTVFTTVCQSSIQIVPSTIVQVGQTTLLTTIPISVVGTVQQTCEVERTACISSTFSQVYTSTWQAVPPVQHETSAMPTVSSSVAPTVATVVPAGETVMPPKIRRRARKQPVYYYN